MTTQKKNKKGRKVPLAEFFDSDSKLVTIRSTSNWSEIVDKEEADATNAKPIIVDIAVLPVAPRAAQDIDYSTVTNDPPFIAQVANLSFQIDDEGLRRIFADLSLKSARVIRDGNRSRGIGLVEFETRDHLIEALKRTDKELYGRSIRVSVATKNDIQQSESGRPSFGRGPNRTSEDRPGIDGTWERTGPRSEDVSDGRPGSGFSRDKHRGDFQRQNNRGPRDNQEGNSFGYGYPRSRDDRGGQGGNRDHNNRPSQRFRHHDDDNRSNSGADRPRYGGRYSDTRDVRDRPKQSEETQSEQREAPRERQRLQLQPRTKPLESDQTVTKEASSTNNNTTDPSISTNETSETSNRQVEDTSSYDYQNNDSKEAGQADSSAQKAARGAGSEIFGGAKPVDTLTKELEIERKLKEMQLTKSESGDDHEEKHASSRTPFNRGGDRDQHRGKRSSNDDHHPRDRHNYRRDDGRSDHGAEYHHKREHSGGKQYEDEGRRRNEDDQHRRVGERYSGPSRRDNDSTRQNRYHQNNPDRDQERSNYRQRDRDNRHNDSNEFNNQGRSSNNINTESQPRNAQRGMNRRSAPAQETSHRLELSNKFGMLDDDDLDAGDDNEEPQSPSVGE